MPDTLATFTEPVEPTSTARCAKKRTARRTFSPTRFVDDIAAALDRISNGDGTLVSKDRATLIAALEPLMGDFTVSDACFLFEPLYRQMMRAGVPREVGNLASAAAYALRDFICCASATSPRDVGARADFWANNKTTLDEGGSLLLSRMMYEDIGDLLHNYFADGDLFSGAHAFPEQSESEPMAWWDRRAEMLGQLAARVQ